MKGVDTRSTVRRQPWWRLVLPPVMVLIVVAGVLLVFVDARRDSISLDANLCPIDADDISGSIAFLFDFSKPLDAAQSGLPSGLLNEVSLRMARNQELNLFLLTGSQSGPRTLLKRMCKPYANEDLQIEAAKDQGGAVRDCNDLPAQLPADTREVATKFCAHLEAFAPRLDALARQDWPEERKVDNAYLIEALEDIRLELAERPEPLVIYVFSDMMQHADWYSHLDQDWSQWSHEEFAELMASQNWAIGDRLSVADWRVEVFYLPRRGLTDQPRVREVHQRFWREYFAGVELAFHVQAPGPPYSAVPLMNVLTEAEIAAQEREVVERLLREVREEQQELERQREETRRRLLEEQERLEQERDRLRLAELQQPAATPGGRDSEEPVPPEAAGGEGGEGDAKDEGDAEGRGGCEGLRLTGRTVRVGECRRADRGTARGRNGSGRIIACRGGGPAGSDRGTRARGRRARTANGESATASTARHAGGRSASRLRTASVDGRGQSKSRVSERRKDESWIGGGNREIRGRRTGRDSG